MGVDERTGLGSSTPGVEATAPENCGKRVLLALSHAQMTCAAGSGTWRQEAVEIILWKWRESAKHEAKNRQTERANGMRGKEAGSGALFCASRGFGGLRYMNLQ